MPEEGAAWARAAFEKLKGAELRPRAEGVSGSGAGAAAAGVAVELLPCAGPDAADAEAGWAAACRNQVIGTIVKILDPEDFHGFCVFVQRARGCERGFQRVGAVCHVVCGF